METYVSDTYGWSPMSQTPMAGALCLRPLWLETYHRHICVSDNLTLIDLLISYALYVA